MTMIKVYDGKKTVSLTGNEGWTIHGENDSQESADKLYSLVSWFYRCVTVRGNSVAAMPFVIKRGKEEVYEFDGLTPQDDPPKDITWVKKLPLMLGKVEVANVLGGRAYFERRQNVLGTRDLFYDWFLPWSVIPVYNGIANRYGTRNDPNKSYGDLLGFWRDFLNLGQQPIFFEPEEMVYFWMPDYATEIGPAFNYPAKAVFRNANVVGNMDLFLAGYFERGMIKATLLKYKERIQDDEKGRVKEWWERTVTGVKNAFATEIVRGDFETMTIGEGIKDLRDNALNADEKKDIAVGTGVPLSKVDSTASTDSNREADDRQYIEDTIIPEINWIYAVVNEQMLNPLGYSIVANPQELRVMQADENDRSQAFSNYRNGGLSVEAAVGILGIHVPDDVEMREPKAPVPPQLAQFNGQDEIQQPEQDIQGQTRAIDIIELMGKRDEIERLKRWLNNRDEFNLDDFKSELLTDEEKRATAYKAIAGKRRNDEIPVMDRDEIQPDSPEVDEATRRFDRLFPKEKGLLDAAVVENA